MALRQAQRDKILTAKAATGTGTAINVADFRNAVVEISTQGSANLTVKLQAAMGIGQETGQTAPDFSSAASATNPWVYVQSIDLSNGNAIAGATGYAFAGTDAVYLVEVNINEVDWLCATVTARAAGSVNVRVVSVDNQ